MAQYSVPIHAEEGPFDSGGWLPMDAYKTALKRMVKYCHDVVLIDPQGRFLLPRRALHKTPPGVWFVGGQVKPFIPLTESLSETVKREIGIRIPTDRFEYLGQIRSWFNGKDKGGVMHDSLSEVFAVHLSKDEIAALIMDPDEYEPESLTLYDQKQLETIPNRLIRGILADLWERHATLHA